ncbi:multiple epidermal growth factor-like domains protein 10 [Aethina tumida]|uniref:multiple epidermal growth factor-like domains protein 10 n=1 Tax=Aethina tumida TaxID=116153 RepID=UPI002147F321|nr:multiple epidermal growth factor-like domains protein 10 [Aethina tumida]
MYKMFAFKCVICLISVLSILILPSSQQSSRQPCREDADCFKISENSVCLGNTLDTRGECACKSGFNMLLRNRTFFYCGKNLNYSNPCLYKEECTYFVGSLSVCEFRSPGDGVCSCGPGSHLYQPEMRCYKDVLLHDVCSSSAECRLRDDTYANCVVGHCTCNSDSVPNETRDQCVISKRLGDHCSSDSDCKTPNSYCGNEICTCRQGYSVCKHQSYCLRDATEIGDPCTEDVQCATYLPGTTCSYEKKCTCDLGEHYTGTQCVVSKKVGESCDSDAECVYDKKLKDLVSCVDRRCECVYGPGNETMECGNGATVPRIAVSSVISLFIFVLTFY